MKKIFLIQVLIITLTKLIYSQALIFQELAKSEKGWGNVNIISNNNSEDIIEKHINVNQKAKGISGYRIQVYFASGNEAKNQAYKLKTELRNAFPSFESYVVYEEPFFKVRIGDFRTKLEAYKLFNIIKITYPSAFIVEDLVSYENLP